MQLNQLRRREFITLLGGVTVWPFAAHTAALRDKGETDGEGKT